MEENNKSGYTAEGRKLRPRRPRISNRVYSSSDASERRGNYGHSDNGGRGGYGSSERRSYGNSERRSSEGRSYGHSEGRPSYGSGRRAQYGGGEDRNYGNRDRRSYGSQDRRSYGSSENRGYGQSENRGYSDSRNSGEARRSYGSQDRRTEGRGFGPSGRRAPSGGGRPQSGAGRNYGAPGRRPFGAGKPAGKPAGKFQGNGRGAGRPAEKRQNPYKFNENDEQNINIMLSRKPQIDQIQLSDNDTVETPIKDVIRLNKFIANSGICSRREADQYIQAGVVTVNDEVVTELGTKVNVFTDDIKFNGERIRGEEKVYIVMNKPKGYVTTASDPHAEKTVMDLLKKCSARVFPVGRLDKNTTGVLMFTNDGEIAERLTHPSYDKKKIYQVILDKPITQEDFDQVLSGVSLNDGDIKADELEYIDAEDHRKLGIEIHSGKNRIVRRIFESLGYEVKALDRVYFAGLTKKGLKKGEWRYLSEGESNILKMGAYL
ncbi:MAG: pseudouridine synthase [Candidatus Cryptobacteroides sp.]|nr:pseudouridine synthase [Bacteroidales bacterium]MDD7153611.1 pseudouridine synthase [Bacteroidales bacterium]MDY5495294.1 pseudouridine synthase [Candidatus Cryptobacteroides sp.]